MARRGSEGRSIHGSLFAPVQAMHARDERSMTIPEPPFARVCGWRRRAQLVLQTFNLHRAYCSLYSWSEMMTTSPHPLTDRFAWLIECLFKVISRESSRRPPLEAPLAMAITNWARRLVRRFAALHAKWKAGKLPAAGPAQRRAASPRPADKPRTPSLLPRTFAWLHRLFPESAPGGAEMMYPLLEDPELLALFAAAPQLGRILRPYCRMVGIRPPAWLALPRRKRAPRPPRDRGSCGPALSPGSENAPALRGSPESLPPSPPESFAVLPMTGIHSSAMQPAPAPASAWPRRGPMGPMAGIIGFRGGL